MEENKTPRRRRNRKEASKERKGSIVKDMLGTLLYVVVVCFFVFLILKYVGQRTVVDGSSMSTTLENGENLIMDKISYRFHDPERFDIVIFPGVEDETTGERPYYIKRIIGLPGETVQIKDGLVYIDGEQLTEDVYGITDYIDEAGIAADGLTLGDDEYFCMGDNRPISLDSRYPEVGPVQREEIVGKAILRIWPLSKIGFLE